MTRTIGGEFSWSGLWCRSCLDCAIGGIVTVLEVIGVIQSLGGLAAGKAALKAGLKKVFAGSWLAKGLDMYGVESTIESCIACYESATAEN